MIMQARCVVSCRLFLPQNNRTGNCSIISIFFNDSRVDLKILDRRDPHPNPPTLLVLVLIVHYHRRRRKRRWWWWD